MRRSDSRCERVDAGVLDELQRHLDRMYVARLVGAHVVLDPPDALDLTLDIRAIFARLLDDLGRLAGVLLDVQMGTVEQDRVPARLQAGGRPFAVGAVIEVKSDRHGCIFGHSAEHLVEDLGPDRLHCLDGRLDDQGGVELGSRVDHRPQADVVDDVERRYAVPLLEGGVENVSEGDDGHFDRASLSGICAFIHLTRPKPTRKNGPREPVAGLPAEHSRLERGRVGPAAAETSIGAGPVRDVPESRNASTVALFRVLRGGVPGADDGRWYPTRGNLCTGTAFRVRAVRAPHD